MSITPKDFLEHCENIRDGNDSEIIRRDVISRGYYYVYHYIRTRWESEENYPSGGSKHIAAQEFLKEEVGKDLADDLDDLHGERKLADYRLSKTISKLDMRLFEAERDEFIQTVKSSTLES